MTELLSSSGNYNSYRRVYGDCTDFKIPILGVHLKDLISLHEALPDYVEDSKINVHKLQILFNHINELVQLQNTVPPLEANKDLVHLLTVSWSYSDDVSFLHVINVPTVDICTMTFQTLWHLGYQN